MTAKQFYEWQLDGGTDDVMRMVAALERADIPWCAIGGVAVNNWANDPMVTQDVDFVVAQDRIEQAVQLLAEAGFQVERRHFWMNFKGKSKVNIQLSTEDFYAGFPARSKPGEIHGILFRVAAPEDVLAGKIKAWNEPSRGKFKRKKDELDIARLVMALPSLWERLPDALKMEIDKPGAESAS